MSDRPGVVRFQVLGPLAATRDGRALKLGGIRQRRILAALIIAGPSGLTLDQLVERVWDDAEAPDEPIAPLRVYVNRLRKELEPERSGRRGEILRTGTGGYELEIGDGLLDAAAFEQLVVAARSIGNPTEALDLLQEALRMWRGDAFGDLAQFEWAQLDARRLDELRLQAQELALGHRVELGLHAEAISEVEGLIQAHPYRESFRRIHMLALYQANRQVDALRSFDEHSARLLEEMGIDSSQELQELNHRILTHDQSLQRPAGRRLRDYRLGRRIRADLDGEVYEAVQPTTGRQVIVHVLAPERSNDAEFIRSFDVEASAVARLEHPHLVDLVDFWREPGHAYLVFRRMSGRTLAELEAGALSSEAAAVIALQVSAAAATALAAGVELQPIRPEHIAFDASGNAYLGGFALGAQDPPASEADIVRSLQSVLWPVTSDVTVLESIFAASGDTGLDDAIAVLQGLAGADDMPPISPSAANPYRGLAAFSESDASVFFGRSAFVARVLERMGTSRLIGVVGPSGVGKSSVVRAGVVPALRTGALPGSADWFVSTMVPGASPIKSLHEAISQVAHGRIAGPEALRRDGAALSAFIESAVPDGSEVVLVIDQFEELFTLAHDQSDPDFVLDLLVEAITAPASRLRVVLTLRADQYDRPLGHSGFGRLLSGSTVALPAMAATELAEAIEGPAGVARCEVEAGLAGTMVADAIARPAALPLLQFTLTSLHDDGEGRLTLRGYEELGGLGGALVAHAERQLGGRPDDEVQAVQRLLLSLVSVSDTGEPTKQRVSIAELSRLPGVSLDLIDDLIRSRLVLADRDAASRRPTIELAHEALIDEWPRLAGWIDESRQSLVTGRRVAAAARIWEEGGEQAADLIRGHRLDAGAEWRDSPVSLATDLEERFIAASIRQRDAEERAARDREAGDERAAQRLRSLSAAAVVVAVFAVVAGLLAFTQSRRAADEAKVAVAEREAAELSSLINESLSQLEGRPDTGLLLAVEAFRRQPTIAAQRALLTGLTTLEYTTSVLEAGELGEVAPECVSVGPGATFHASRGSDRFLLSEVPDEPRRAELVTTSISVAPPNSSNAALPEACAAYRVTRGDRTLTTDSDWSPLMLDGDGSTLWGPLPQLSRPTWPDDDVLFAKQGSITSLREWVRVDPHTGDVLRKTGLVASQIHLPPGAARGLAFLTVNSGGGPVEGAVVDAGSLTVLDELGRIPQPSLRVSFSPDGSRVGYVTADDRLLVWDLTVGRLVIDVPADLDTQSDGGARSWIEFNPSGTVLAALGTPGLVGFRSPATGETVGDIVEAEERLLHALWLDDSRIVLLLESGRLQVIDRAAAETFSSASGVRCCDDYSRGPTSGLPAPYVVVDGVPGPFGIVGEDFNDRFNRQDLVTGEVTSTRVDAICCDPSPDPIALRDGTYAVVKPGMRTVFVDAGGSSRTEWQWGQDGVWDRVPAFSAFATPGAMAVALIPEQVNAGTAIRTGLLDLSTGAVTPPTTVVFQPERGPIRRIQLVDGPHLVVYEQLASGAVWARILAMSGEKVGAVTLPEVPEWIRAASDGTYVLVPGEPGIDLHRSATGDVSTVRTSALGAPLLLRDGRFLVGDEQQVASLWEPTAPELIGAVGTTSGYELVPRSLAADESSIWLLADNEWTNVPLDPLLWATRACDVAGRELSTDEWEAYVPWERPADVACRG